MAQQAVGMIECKGLCALMEACDAALKAANVTMTGWEKIGSGYVIQRTQPRRISVVRSSHSTGSGVGP